MRKFSFKFESVLKQRKIREDEALRALGNAQRAYQAEIAEKARLLGLLEEGLRRRESLGGDPVPVLSFQIEESYIQGNKHRITRAEQAILRASKNVEKALRGYLHTRRQTRTIEILREKAYEQFKRECAKMEQKLNDDITVLRARMREELV